MNEMKIIEGTLKGGLIFLIGFLACMFFVYSYIQITEKPLGIDSYEPENYDLRAPSNWIKEDQIHVYEDKIVIDIEGPSLSKYAPSGSMKPVLDAGANGIRVKPETSEDIYVGDIISFISGSDLVVHRVVEKGYDDGGVYFITKGDNNDFDDGKVRFGQVRYVTVALIW
jgi:hypothetical protein